MIEAVEAAILESRWVMEFDESSKKRRSCDFFKVEKKPADRCPAKLDRSYSAVSSVHGPHHALKTLNELQTMKCPFLGSLTQVPSSPK